MHAVILPALLAVIAGMSVLTQQVLNANLRVQLDSAIWSGFMSYFLGILSMVALAVVLGEALPPAATIARVPWWAWIGGIFGAIFIGLSILVVPILGATAFISLLVTGQMLAALAFDHFGWLGLPQRPIDLTRCLGVALLVSGVILIRR